MTEPHDVPIVTETGEELDGELLGDVIEAEVVEDETEGGPPPADLATLEPADLGIDLPADPGEARQALLQEVARSRRDAAEHLGDLRRVAAEFDNYRKRMVRERSEVVGRAAQRVVESLLPVLDSFDAAFTHEPQTPTEEKLVVGMRSTYHQLLDVLQKEGLEIIDAAGEPFDPEVHEAVASPADGDGHLVVADELRRGYRLRGRVIRPALVAVDHA